MGNIQMVGKSQAPMFRGEKPRDTKLAPHWSLERVAKHAVDFWLSTEDLPMPENRVTVDRDGKLTLSLHADQRRAEAAALREAQVDARQARHARAPPDPPLRLHEERDPGRRRRPPGGHVPLRHRPGDVGPRPRLQGARARQPLRRRHERLPVDRRGQPGADRDGELAARRRPPARAARRQRREARQRRRRPDVADRPRVVILGGGFAGVGAAQKLEKADADVVLVDRHDYHTFQPLLYQLATGLLETDGGRPFASRPRPRSGQRDGPQGGRDRRRPRGARGQLRRAGAAHLRLPRPRRSAPRSTSSAPRARRSTRSRCTR